MPSWYHSCSYAIQEVYASPLAKSIWGEVKRGSDGQKMDHRILLPGDSAEHRNRSTFVLYHLNEQASSFRARMWRPDFTDLQLGPTKAFFLSRHIAFMSSPACQYLIACPCCSFQKPENRPWRTFLKVWFGRLPPARKLFVVKAYRGGKS